MVNITYLAAVGVFLFAIGTSLLVTALRDTSSPGPLLGALAGVLLGFGLLLIGRETRYR